MKDKVVTWIKGKFTWRIIKILKKVGIGFLLFFSIILIIAFFWGVISGYFLMLFPPVIKSLIALEIMKALITVNGVLIGFAGLIFTNLLMIIHNRLFDLSFEYEKAPYDEKKFFKPRLKELEKKRRNIIMALVLTVMAFIGSIFFTIPFMSIIQLGERSFMPRESLYVPFFFFILGIICILFISIQIKVTPSYSNDQNQTDN